MGKCDAHVFIQYGFIIVFVSHILISKRNAVDTGIFHTKRYDAQIYEIISKIIHRKTQSTGNVHSPTFIPIASDPFEYTP